MKKLLTLTLIGSLMACSPAPDSTSAQTPVSTSPELVTAQETQDHDAIKAELDNLMRTNHAPGSPITVAGTPATTCVYGDGFGIHLVAAGPNTSCEFAKAVMSEQTAQLNATENNIRDHLQPSISVASPVTGQTYDMQCATEPSALIRCTGGDNATVFMY